MSWIEKTGSLSLAAVKAGMDRKTARKYRDSNELPSETRKPRTWRTRRDAFEEVWDEEVRPLLETNAGLEAKTIFEMLQRIHPGRFSDGQLRTLQRRVKVWRSVEGPAKEVFFPQQHRPGDLSQSDFTHMKELGVRIQGAPFEHLLYHFVLSYSNWETGRICFSESFESLSAGMQEALWELGGVPRRHRTDRLSAAVHKLDHPEEFTRRYEGLLRHYGLEGEKAMRANENGDVEQGHSRFKKAVDQALMLRGSRDFESRQEYEQFLRSVFTQRNAGRRARFEEELRVLRRLPLRRLDASRRVEVRVGPSSTVRVLKNTYSVDSRLIGEKIEVRVQAEHLEVWYAQRRLDTIPRLRGQGRHSIQYRHIIDWLVRKPGAFAAYRYREDLFPTSRFRRAYDALRQRSSRADREYLQILELGAKEGESRVDEALALAFERGETITFEGLERRVVSADDLPELHEVTVEEVDLSTYDELLLAGRGE